MDSLIISKLQAPDSTQTPSSNFQAPSFNLRVSKVHPPSLYVKIVKGEGV